MFSWFRNDAPIHIKFRILILIYSATAIGSIVATCFAVIMPGDQPAMYPAIVAAMAAVTIATAVYSAKAISTPYVTTVLRTEALAAGDLTSPILFTDHRDCVGRLTTAISVFRDIAQEIASPRSCTTPASGRSRWRRPSSRR